MSVYAPRRHAPGDRVARELAGQDIQLCAKLLAMSTSWPCAIASPHAGPAGRNLVQADLEAASAALLDAGLPLFAGLAEEVVVEQVKMLRVRRTAPDVVDGVERACLAFLLGDDAEPTFQPAATLRWPWSG